MSSHCSVALTFLLLQTFTVLCVGSHFDCSGAGLYKEEIRSKLIDDCDLVNNQLYINLYRLTSKPGCIRGIKFHFKSKTSSTLTELITIGNETAFTLSNPLASTERCVSKNISVGVFFWTQRENELMYQEKFRP